MKSVENEEDDFARKEGKVHNNFTSYFDINQLELAFINRALRGVSSTKKPTFVEIGKTERILLLQKKNLERLCRKVKREYREGALESEIKRILTGEKIIAVGCLPPKHES